MPISDALRRVQFPLLVLFLIAVWLGGGATEDSRSVDEWLSLIALLPLGASLLILCAEFPRDRLIRAGIVIAALIALVPCLQLLPIPESLWSAIPARKALLSDLHTVGVETVDWRWSLTPMATEHALWSLLPALAAFLAVFTLDAKQRRRLLQVLVAVLGCNVLFAFFQAGLPADSALRIYPSVASGFGGLLVNTNHQGTACIIGMVLSIGLGMEAWLRSQRGEISPQRVWLYALAAIGFLLTIPLSTSRAAMVIALPALALVVVLTGVVKPTRHGRRHRVRLLVAALMGVVALIGLYSAMGWMGVDLAEEKRHVFALATLKLGMTHAPLGGGFGSFVPLFAAAAPPDAVGSFYVNHAHNEYVQWWLESGIFGVLVLASALALLGVALRKLIALRGRGTQAVLAATAWVSVAAVLMHSWADFPLRTLTLMTTTALLAGVMLAALADARARGRKSSLVQDART